MDTASVQQLLMAVTVSLPRLLGFFQAAPFMASGTITGMMRTGIGLVFMPLLIPLVLPSLPAELFTANVSGMLVMVAILLKEAILGFFLGYLVGLLFWAMQSAGFLMDNQRGASMAEGADPLSQENTTPLGSFLFQSAVMIFFSLGGFIAVMQALLMSYRFWPPLDFFPSFDSYELTIFFVRQVTYLFATMLLIAAPMVMACFLSDFCLGLINRFAPQLEVFSLSMPIKSIAVIALLVPFYYVLVSHLTEGVTHLHFMIEQFGFFGLNNILNVSQ